QALTATLETVQGHYAHLFEREDELTDARGNLVFTGVEEDPETLGTLRAMRSARARELLTKLLPAILKALAGAADPDTAFVQFDRFLSALPSGVQLFSLFQARPEFLGLLARIVGAAPRLAGHLAREPATLDALLDSGFLHSLPSPAALQASL